MTTRQAVINLHSPTGHSRATITAPTGEALPQYVMCQGVIYKRERADEYVIIPKITVAEPVWEHVPEQTAPKIVKCKKCRRNIEVCPAGEVMSRMLHDASYHARNKT